MTSEPLSPRSRLKALEARFHAPTRQPRLFLLLSLLILTSVGGALVGRGGTVETRALGAALIVLAPLFALAWAMWAQRRQRYGGALRALEAVDQEQALGVARALALDERLSAGKPETGESSELAALHLDRAVARIDAQRVVSAGQRRGRRVGWFALLGASVAVVSILLATPLRIVEGLNVVLARDGAAPLRLPYLESVEQSVKAPAYLSGSADSVPLLGSRVSLPRGTVLQYTIVPRFFDRRFVLTDGSSQVRFVEDGQGALVARFTIDDAAKLRVAAQFGQVLIYDQGELAVAALEDRAPLVMLDQAPRTLALNDMDRLDLVFSARDDHGLSAVDVVMQSGRRESRMEVVRLDGQTRAYRGGHAITREHPFLQGAFLPVLVRVEARDNDSISGPKWGVSEAITLMPAPLGKEVADRHRQLREFRSALVAYFSADIDASRRSLAEARLLRQQEHSRLEHAFEELEHALGDNPRAPRGTLMFLRAQLQALAPAAEESVRPESVLLAADSLIDELAGHDAREVAEELGALAEEIATRAAARLAPAEGDVLAPVEPLVGAAGRAAKELAEIGRLGLDLGTVAEADLARVSRAVQAAQWQRAEAAALHMAARLRRGSPSFGAKGNPAVESGSPMGGGAGSGHAGAGSGSSAPSEYEQLVERADAVAQDHAQQLTELERLLEQARRAAAQDLADPSELEEAGQQLRDALSELPSVGYSPGTARSEAAQARGQGEAMADSLEARSPADAVERGQAALEALKRARDQLEQYGGWVSEGALDRAERALEQAMNVAEAARKQVQQGAQQNSKQQLGERAVRERELAQRVDELLRQARQGEARLPGKNEAAMRRAAQLMREAAQAMEAGQGDKARERAEAAQRELEEAQPESTQPAPGETGAGEGNGNEMAQDAGVPEAEEDLARRFRERVERGLGRYGGRLAPAVRRYAEELK